MTTFRQGPTPWFRDDQRSQWMARGVEPGDESTAMAWASDEVLKPSAESREMHPEDFIRQAIQRCYR